MEAGDELRGTAALTGIGELPPSKSPQGGRSAMELMAQAARLAIEDAGIDKRDIDGLLIAPPGMNLGMMMIPSYYAEYFEIRPRYANIVDMGGASAAAMAWRAAAAIAAGQCRRVLCLTGEAFDRQGMMQLAQRLQIGVEEAQFEQPYGPMGVNYAYALAARRHMHEFGTTPTQLAKVAVDQRTNACANPMALFHGKPLSTDDVLSSRLVVDPLHLLDIVMPCSGAAAFIVEDRAGASAAGRRPVWLLGAAEAMSHAVITRAPDLTTTPIADAAPRAFAMAGVAPADIDLISVYDCYTIMVILTLEDAGFCPKGQGGPYVMDHDLTYRGDRPVNTHGGQLSFGQPGLAGGASHITEAVRQLRGEAGERQMDSCRLAYVNGNGGVMSEEVSLVLGA